MKPLLVRAERARQRWSGLLVDEELHALDDLVERVLKARLHIFKCETFAYNASNDVIQAEQMAGAQLKVGVQEWENRIDNFKVVVESRFSEELNPTVYPQSPHIRQRHVQGLCQTLVAKKHRLKTSIFGSLEPVLLRDEGLAQTLNVPLPDMRVKLLRRLVPHHLGRHSCKVPARVRKHAMGLHNVTGCPRSHRQREVAAGLARTH